MEKTSVKVRINNEIIDLSVGYELFKVTGSNGFRTDNNFIKGVVSAISARDIAILFDEKLVKFDHNLINVRKPNEYFMSGSAFFATIEQLVKIKSFDTKLSNRRTNMDILKNSLKTHFGINETFRDRYLHYADDEEVVKAIVSLSEALDAYVKKLKDQ